MVRTNDKKTLRALDSYFLKLKDQFFTVSMNSIQADSYWDFFSQKGVLNRIFSEFFPLVDSKKRFSLRLISWKTKLDDKNLLTYKVEGKTYTLDIFTKWKLVTNLENYVIEQSQTKKNLEELLLSFLEERFKIIFLLEKKVEAENLFYFRSKTKKPPFKVKIKFKKQDEKQITIDFKSEEETELLFFSVPALTNNSTFIINGHEKVIISQLVRCPGIYYKEGKVKVADISRKSFSALIVPGFGIWFEINNAYRSFTEEKKDPKEKTKRRVKGLLFFKLKKSKKIFASFLLAAFGLERDKVFSLLGESKFLANTYDFSGEISFEEAVEKVNDLVRHERSFFLLNNPVKQLINFFFNSGNFNWTEVGVHQVKRQLSIINRVKGLVLAETIYDHKQKLFLEQQTILSGDNLKKLELALRKGYCRVGFTSLLFPETKQFVDQVKIYNQVGKVAFVVDVSRTKDEELPSEINIPYFLSIFSYVLNCYDELVTPESVDDLSNKRVRNVSELMTSLFTKGITDITKKITELVEQKEEVQPYRLSTLFYHKTFKIFHYEIRRFFNLSPLIQFMDQTNPAAEVSNKRHVTVLGPHGLVRSRAGVEVRDVDRSSYGKICPAETPEGPNVGLNTNFAMYTLVDKLGLKTPYWEVIDSKITLKIKYLSASEEKGFIIANYDDKIMVDKHGTIVNEFVDVRFGEENFRTKTKNIDFIDFANDQIFSVSTSCIPFVGHNDANRVLMGANMLRQAIPIVKSELPIVYTGNERLVVKNTSAVLHTTVTGIVKYVDSQKIIIKVTENEEASKTTKVKSDNKKKQKEVTYFLTKFFRTNQNTVVNHVACVKVNEKVKAGDIIAGGMDIKEKQLALGNNILVAFMLWRGYNYEDGVIVSERLVNEDLFTSLHIKEFTIERRTLTISGKKSDEEEIFTRDIPLVSMKARRHLDERGIVALGTRVKEGDILVGKITPNFDSSFKTDEEECVAKLFTKKVTVNFKNTSLVVPQGIINGVVCNVRSLKVRERSWDSNVIEIVKVYIAETRKIAVGDKLSGRHGNKGVISKIIPVADMPFLPDGTPIDVILNPLGVPSRMNIGQIFESFFGYLGDKLKRRFHVPLFKGYSDEEIKDLSSQAGVENFCQTTLRDGMTGKLLGKKINVGKLYLLKLSHMVVDKIYSRNVGPYSLISQQPLSGKKQGGGQKMGEMEFWAMIAYGAAFNIREMLTIKSNDIEGRNISYSKIISGDNDFDFSLNFNNEAFNFLVTQFKGLGFKVEIFTHENKAKDKPLNGSQLTETKSREETTEIEDERN